MVGSFDRAETSHSEITNAPMVVKPSAQSFIKTIFVFISWRNLLFGNQLSSSALDLSGQM